MKIKYDPEVDAMYISLKKSKNKLEVTTVCLNEDIAIDLGPKEEVVGIEILDASHYFGMFKTLPKIELENLKVA